MGGTKETTDGIENKDVVEGNNGEKETTDEIDKLVTVDGDDVVTVDDDEGEENIPSVTIPDVVFFDSVSDEEKKYYEDNPIPLDKVEDMKFSVLPVGSRSIIEYLTIYKGTHT